MATKGNILVVDDEINLCRIVGAKLTKSGYNVVTVHDGLQAVDKVRESDFDLVLLDLFLPKMDGLSALAEIRKVHNKLPVIIMTANEDAEAIEQAKSHGVSAYVNKPFDLDNLVSLVIDTSQGAAGKGRRLPDSTVLFTKDQPIVFELQNGQAGRTYESMICDKNDRTLSIYAPLVDGRIMELPPNSSIKVGLAARDAYYSFTTQVLRSSTYEGSNVIVLDKPRVIYRAQRRQFPRIPMRIPVKYGVFVEDSSENVQMKQGETRDVSLGGACITVAEEIKPGEILHVELRPKTKVDKIRAIAEVLQSRRDKAEENCYILGCRFREVDDSIRKLLSE